MPPTTEYGEWTYGSNHRVEDTVAGYLGEFAADYDLDGLVAAYREAINAALPGDIVLAGDSFYGPYPKPDGYGQGIQGAIDSVDLDALAEQYNRTES
jgi:hypothetical protein